MQYGIVPEVIIPFADRHYPNLFDLGMISLLPLRFSIRLPGPSSKSKFTTQKHKTHLLNLIRVSSLSRVVGNGTVLANGLEFRLDLEIRDLDSPTEDERRIRPRGRAGVVSVGDLFTE